MATMNPFDLLGDDDTGDVLQLIAAQQNVAAAQPKKAPPQPKAKPVAAAAAVLSHPPSSKLPSKPLPPAQFVREARNEGGWGGAREGGRGGGRGRGRGRGGYNRNVANSENSFSNSGAPAGQGAPEDGDSGNPSERRGYGSHGGNRGGRLGGFANGEVDGERPRRIFERRSGTGRGNEIKREGAGRGNWGTQTDELALATEDVVNEGEKGLGDKKRTGEEQTADGNKENPADETEAKEPEPEDKVKEMTLEEYEKVLEEKRKALQALKTEERKVDAKAFESMQQLSSKKDGDDVFIKLGSDKDKRKDALEKDERAKKSVSINEFLKPAEGERYYNPSGRGRGRGRGSREYVGRDAGSNAAAPSIEDPGQFPTLGGK